MKLTQTELSGCFILEPNVFTDSRGYFFESFNKETFEKITGQTINFVQDNISNSSKGVIRGLHYQTGEFAQAKLVQVVSGKIIDIAVDLRPESLTFKKHISIELSCQNKKQLFIPRGFAHGFIALTDNTILNYKCDNYFNKQAEAGIKFDDPELNINWKINSSKYIISDKDLKNPLLKDAIIKW